MKVLLVNGSPHEKGCTYTALCEAAEAIRACGVEAEIHWVGDGAFYSCRDCGACGRTGLCAFGSDGVNTVIEKLREADGVILGAPVHYASAAGAFSALLDRVFYAGGSFAHKLGAAVVSARRAGTTASFDQLNKYFTIAQMPVISSKYWNMVHGNTPEEVRQDLEGMQVMRTLGRNMAYWLKLREAGEKAGILPPEQETPIATNFIR